MDQLDRCLRVFLGEPTSQPQITHGIYADESGTNQQSCRSIFAGIIAPVGYHMDAVNKIIDGIINKHVPERIREGFVFHATEVYNGQNKKNGAWPLEQRLALIDAMCALPSSLGFPICVGTQQRNFFQQYKQDFRDITDFLLLENMCAFAYFLSAAHRYMKRSPLAGAQATINCEQAGKVNKYMRRMLHSGQRESLIMNADEIKRSDLVIPDVAQNGGLIELRADLVAGEIIFENKGGSPLLQCADACAFAFNRYLNRRSYGERFVQAMHHRPLPLSDWSGPSSSCVLDGNVYPKGIDWSSGRQFLLPFASDRS